MTMQQSENITELAAALAKAQAEIGAAKRDSENPHFKTRYADLASVWDAIRQPLTKHGIAVVQAPGTDDTGAVTMTTSLVHNSGQWMRSTVGCKPAKIDAQSVGSVITYLRRYALAAMVGVAPDDDDGEAAIGRGAVKEQPPKQPKPKPTPEQMVIRVPVLADNSGPDWEAWRDKISKSIQRVPDLDTLNTFWSANRAGLTGFLAANQAGAEQLQQELKQRQMFFASAPGE